MALLTVHAKDVDVAGIPLRAELPAPWLSELLDVPELSVPDAGKVDVRLTRSRQFIVVRGRAEAHVHAPCARCLQPVPLSLNAELTLLLKPDSEAPGRRGRDRDGEEEYEFSAEEAEIDTFDGETVILDGFVREALLLEIPQFPLCSEDCAGIAQPHRGASWALDRQQPFAELGEIFGGAHDEEPAAKPAARRPLPRSGVRIGKKGAGRAKRN